MSKTRDRVVRYGIALLAVGAAFLLRFALDHVIATETPFLLFGGAVMASAWYGGFGPGIFATALASLAIDYFLLPPYSSFAILSLSKAVSLLVFAIEGIVISGLGGSLHRAAERAEIARSGAEQTERARAELLARERRTRELAQAGERRAAFLSEAAALFTASLEYRDTLERTARLAVPFLADWCSIDMLETDGAIRRIALAHADPAKADLAQAMLAYPLDPEGRHPRTEVLRTGRSLLRAEVTDADVDAAATTPEQLQVMRRIGYRSVMIVALVARGQTLGVITFATAESGRRYDAADLALAEELARRAALAIDNTRLYEAEQRARVEAENASRAKDEFLATVSHELRTPLTPILAWTGMLRRGTLDAAASERGLRAIERSAKAQAQLVEDLLDVSRITSGKMRLDMRPVDVAAVVEAAIDSARPVSEAKGVSLEVELAPHAGPTSGDATRLQQVAWNLLSNAIKFTPKGGRVEVVLEHVDAHVQLTVSDTGQGIKPEFLPYVFERFRQAESGTTRAHAGLGLGLAIVRHLVELHGGTVHVSSAGEGQGAVFTVRLPIMVTTRPLAQWDVRHPPMAIGGADHFTLAGLAVLVVDDDADTCEVVGQLLTSCGASVRTALSAAKALAELDRGPADLLICDIGMPGEDGYALIRQVRGREARHGGRVPALALTAYARVEDRLQVLSSGFQMHLPKPVEPAELIRVVANLASMSRPADD